MITDFALVLIITNLLSLILALELLAEKKHIKLFLIAFGLLDIISIPFGTILGIYMVLCGIKSKT